MKLLVKSLISAVKSLQANKAPLLENHLSEKVIEIVFNIGKSGLAVIEEDRVIIGPLIKEIIPALDNCLFDLGLKFDPDRGQYNLVLRSGVQYLLDNFKDFPVAENQVLGEFLKTIQDSESLQTFDEELFSWRDNPTVSLESISHSASDLSRPVGVPETHRWWS